MPRHSSLVVLVCAIAVGLPASVAQVSWAQFPANVPPVAAPSTWSPMALAREYTGTPAGCVDVSSADQLDAWLKSGSGAIKGFDSPRIVPLPDGRFLWLVQDAFIDYDATTSRMADMHYANSAVFVQDQAGCFTALARGDRFRAESFEPGTDPDDTWWQFWWPAGASAASGQLQILWVEMARDTWGEDRQPLDGPVVHPVATWLAVYDPDTFERLSFAPAPNPGVHPIVGFAAVDDPDAGWTYLFGNTFLQNLALEPVPPFIPHSATITTLARVPLGHLDAAPEFWDGGGWSPDPADAQPIAAEGFVEHIMQPQLIDGMWWSATKPDGFLGNAVIVEAASAPQGPWVPWGTIAAVPHGPRDEAWQGMLTYAPVLAPWLDPSGNPIVVLSQIDPLWYPRNRGEPSHYRPQAIAVPPTRHALSGKTATSW